MYCKCIKHFNLFCYVLQTCFDGKGDGDKGDIDMPDIDAVLEKTEGGKDGKKRLSVERIYQKKTQLEHILLRPDTYIGSVEKVTQVS